MKKKKSNNESSLVQEHDQTTERTQRGYALSTAGWCFFNDVIKNFIQVNGKEPRTVYMSRSLELLIDAYFKHATILRHNNVKSIRELGCKIMGMDVVYDAETFRLSLDEIDVNTLNTEESIKNADTTEPDADHANVTF